MLAHLQETICFKVALQQRFFIQVVEGSFQLIVFYRNIGTMKQSRLIHAAGKRSVRVAMPSSTVQNCDKFMKFNLLLIDYVQFQIPFYLFQPKHIYIIY